MFYDSINYLGLGNFITNIQINFLHEYFGEHTKASRPEIPVDIPVEQRQRKVRLVLCIKISGLSQFWLNKNDYCFEARI